MSPSTPSLSRCDHLIGIKVLVIHKTTELNERHARRALLFREIADRERLDGLRVDDGRAFPGVPEDRRGSVRVGVVRVRVEVEARDGRVLPEPVGVDEAPLLACASRG